jgi:Domain of unknown function (DUF4157)
MGASSSALIAGWAQRSVSVGARIQPKLEVGAADDAFEREADHVAQVVVDGGMNDAVVTNAAPTETIQAKCASCEEEEKNPHPKIRRKTKQGSNYAAGGEISSNDLSGHAGAPLPNPIRAQMETAMGADFGGVRIHTGAHAAELSDRISAQAFTYRNQIFFNQGKFETQGRQGRFLLAHELAHVVQQGGGQSNGATSDVSANAMVQRRPKECGDGKDDKSFGLPPTVVRWTGTDRAETVAAEPLTRVEGNTVGSKAYSENKNWPGGWRCIEEADESDWWVRLHLLNACLHGPGNRPWNIVVASKGLNAAHLAEVEWNIKDLVNQGEVMWYEVQANHFSNAGIGRYFAKSLRVRYGEYDPVHNVRMTMHEIDIKDNWNLAVPACPNEEKEKKDIDFLLSNEAKTIIAALVSLAIGKLGELKLGEKKKIKASKSVKNDPSSLVGRIAMIVYEELKRIGVEIVSQSFALIVETVATGLPNLLVSEAKKSPMGAQAYLSNSKAQIPNLFNNPVNKAVGNLIATISDVLAIFSNIKSIIGTVQDMIALINCLTPPLLGCIKQVLKGFTDDIIVQIARSCMFRGAVRPLLLDISFIQMAPGKLADWIVNFIPDPDRSYFKVNPDSPLRTLIPDTASCESSQLLEYWAEREAIRILQNPEASLEEAGFFEDIRFLSWTPMQKDGYTFRKQYFNVLEAIDYFATRSEDWKTLLIIFHTFIGDSAESAEAFSSWITSNEKSCSLSLPQNGNLWDQNQFLITSSLLPLGVSHLDFSLGFDKKNARWILFRKILDQKVKSNPKIRQGLEKSCQ